MNTVPEHERGVLLLSGGLDSAVVLSMIRSRCQELHALFFTYGQKTLPKERACAHALAEQAHVRELHEVDIGFLGKMTHAALCSQDAIVNSKNEYVPFRNGVFLAIATALAESIRSEIIYIGSLGGDRFCRDNSQQFRDDFERVTESGTNAGERIVIAAPLSDVDKVGAVRRGVEHEVPFALTWSCHNSNDVPCGECSNCIAREKAFQTVGITDPIHVR